LLNAAPHAGFRENERLARRVLIAPSTKGDDMLLRGVITVGALTVTLAGCSAEIVTEPGSQNQAPLAAPASPSTAGAPATSTAGQRNSTFSAGEAHSCALQNGQVYCSGFGYYGQRGDGTVTYTEGTPQRALGLANQVSVAAGLYNSCSLGADGTVWCWGDNRFGQLGNGKSGGQSSTPQHVLRNGVYGNYQLQNVVQIAVSRSTVFALDSFGTVWMWGSLSGSNIAQVATSVTALQVTSQCVLATDHTVWCWQDGLQHVPFLTNVAAISSSTSERGSDADCALLFDGTVKCWGHNFYGELGNGSDAYVAEPGDPSGSPGYDGTQYNWLVTNVLSPDGRTNLSHVVALGSSASSNTMCAITSSGTSYCWGDNSSAQTGNGTWSSTVDLPAPLGSLGGAAAVEISTGLDYGCARTGAGALWCWGSNGYGQFGNGVTNDPLAFSPIWSQSIR
jgi:alpha-tubulin suppressor-like RCC1 family protein